MGSGFKVQGSAPPPAKKTACQIEKETLKKRMTKEGILSILFVKRSERSDIHNSSIVNRHSFTQGFKVQG